MIELSPEIIAIIMLVGVVVLGFTGYPLAIVVGALGLIIGYAAFGDTIARLIYDRTYSLMKSYVILAAPLFIFMGNMLERSGIAEKLYDALYLWLGGLKGGLAIATVLIGTILAACVGIIGASVTMLALVGLPAMVNRGYSRSLASGSVCAGGTLGILIPPSIMLVIYGPMAQISVGKLFFGAFLPGFLLSGLYMSYIAMRSLFQPAIAPAVPPEQRAVSIRKKTIMLASSMLPPVILVLSVLGTIFFGIAPPTEAAAVGAFAATLLALAYRKLNFQVLKDTALLTVKMASFIMLIAALAFAYVGVFLGAGAGDVVEKFILSAPGGRWGAFGMIMFIVFILGFFIDWIGIVFIMVPIISPLVPILGFDPLWFALMVCINLQMAFMTPPFAAAIFFVRGAASPELRVSTADIIRGVTPFVLLIMVGLSLCIAFPQIILWLPSMMIE